MGGILRTWFAAALRTLVSFEGKLELKEKLSAFHASTYNSPPEKGLTYQCERGLKLPRLSLNVAKGMFNFFLMKIAY